MDIRLRSLRSRLARTSSARGVSRAAAGSARGVSRAAAGIAALAFAGASLAQDTSYFRIAAGPADSTYFTMGGVLASAISNPPGSRACEAGGSCGVPGLIAVAVTTEGALANIEAISQDRIDSGLAQADVAYWAYHAKGYYEGKARARRLAAIASLYPEVVHVVVKRGAGVRRIQDLAGKRVSIGTEASGTPIAARAILQAYGVRPSGARLVGEGPARSAEMLRKGQLDGFFVVAGQPVAAIVDLAQAMDIDLLPVKGKQAERLAARLPFFARGQIEGGLYKGAGGVPTLAVPAQWLVSAKADETLVYSITRSLWHPGTRAILDARHPDGKRIRLETALEGLSVPLHPGAARYYREIGLLK